MSNSNNYIGFYKLYSHLGLNRSSQDNLADKWVLNETIGGFIVARSPKDFFTKKTNVNTTEKVPTIICVYHASRKTADLDESWYAEKNYSLTSQDQVPFAVPWDKGVSEFPLKYWILERDQYVTLRLTNNDQSIIETFIEKGFEHLLQNDNGDYIINVKIECVIVRDLCVAHAKAFREEIWYNRCNHGIVKQLTNLPEFDYKV